MIIVNRIAELIIKYRNSDLTKEELTELRQWLARRDEHVLLFCDLTNDNYLYAECARMLEGDIASSWKKIEQQLFNTLSHTPPREEMPREIPPEKTGGSSPALKQTI